MNLEDLALTPGLVARLTGAGLTSSDDVARLCARELLQLPGVGPKAVESIEEALGAAGAKLADDPFGRYTCARHGQPAGDAGLTSFFICRDCSRDWTSEAFDGKGPEWEGEAVTGYCIACNVRKQVRLRQWFLCAVCERVARSVGRSVEAERSVEEFWAASALDDWELEGVDPPRLRRANSRQAGIVATVDFLVSQAGQTVVGIELKTGRSEIGGTGIGTRIGRFQLDVSDCDAIHDAARDAQVVPYVLHAQVIDRAEPPTVRHTATGLWFAEYPSLRDAFLETRQRPRENVRLRISISGLSAPSTSCRIIWPPAIPLLSLKSWNVSAGRRSIARRAPVRSRSRRSSAPRPPPSWLIPPAAAAVRGRDSGGLEDQTR